MFSLIIVDYNSILDSITLIKNYISTIEKEYSAHIVIIQNGNNRDDVSLLIEKLNLENKNTLNFEENYINILVNTEVTIAYCQTGMNLGYAKGNNLGAKISKFIWNDEYLIISNNDIILDSINFAYIKTIFDSNNRIGVIGPKVMTPQGIIQSPQKWASAFRRLILHYWIRMFATLFSEDRKTKILLKYCNDVVPNASSGKCDWVSGCFMILRTKYFFEVGLFDENTFLYGEEMILSRRMERNGYIVYFCDSQKVIHNHAQTTSKSISIMKTRELDFSSVIYYYENYSQVSKVLIKLAKINFRFYKFIYYKLQF